ncbi:hypothetical protein [Streptomyces sp. CC219B]|uniref:hypothetical protein n=1 Tax=Streptomyces sp. CC219B TaxID=3044574 RepID=UPI0024A83ED6|nr:hypothetical protein [Streptomyces sp. CC219B]
MNKPDDQIAFLAPDCYALSVLFRFGDVVVAGFYEPFEVDPREMAVMTFDLPTYAEREAAAKARIDKAAIGHILGGWDLISA